ncbi:MAG: metalloregulator ArsR/SmtB family transcription factor [Pseudomonadota bacterium]
MDQHSTLLDGAFLALADPTRRAVLGRLGEGPASVGELARPFAMALPSFMKHIHMLEGSGWITTRKRGRVRVCVLQPRAFATASAWLAERQAEWEARFDRLDAWLAEHPDTPEETPHV